MMAVGSLTGLYWQRIWKWRRVAFYALIAGIAANVACVSLNDFVAVCLCRGVAGISGGLLCAIYSAYIANAKLPGKIVSVTFLIQTAVEAIFIYSTTAVFSMLGSTGLFILIAALLVLLLPFTAALPETWPSSNTEEPDVEPSLSSRPVRGYVLLLSFLPFVVVQTGIYTFLGAFGRMSANLTVEQTLRGVSWSVVYGALGSVAAFFLSNKMGVRFPIICGVILTILSVSAMVLFSRTPALFVVYISLLQISLIFVNCYLYEALIEANNLLVPAAIPMASFGAAFGAGSIGYILDMKGPIGALYYIVGAMLLTAVLTIPFVGRKSQTSV